MRLTKFGTVTLPEANGLDALPVRYRTNVRDMQNGGYDLDGNNTYLNPTNVNRRAVIINNLQSTFTNIARESNKGRLLLRGQEHDNVEYVTFAKIIQLNPDIDARRYNCEKALEINFMQDYPFWLHSADIEKFLDDGEQLDDYVWNLDGGNVDTITINATGSGVTQGTSTITNNGTTPAYRGYFVLSFQNAYDINYVEIINVTNGLKLKYNLNIADTGDIGDWTFDWLSKSLLTNTSDLDRTGLVLPNSQSDWFRLDVGDNNIEVNLSHNNNTDMTLDIYWSRHFVY